MDDKGDHWTSCPVSGRLRLRCVPLEKTWARVLREAGARVQENVFLRDMRVPGIRSSDGRRIEILATGLPVEQGIPLACDCILVSPLHADGSPWPRADVVDGVALARAEDRKADTYPELVFSEECRLSCLACGVRGRWNETDFKVVK